ncbi:GTP cyclohydrolase 1 [Petrocella atlantisensis]|uniref:GTP cyclohydrolase 1 n=1 Tax=Petrocella atlantisensis TaxID=2173034 RepID=A0A3P7NUD4_9FIRM|nr:GTP cyclohydrolase I FolE [Petrocella atlantisensis]VDN46485.1 GTP cyclohydrolase 1 [Petrocella atlantisensis]
MIDKKAIEDHIRGILIALGDDPNREGLRDTPTRVANMYAEVFEGMAYTNDELIEKLGVTFDEEEIYDNSKQDMVLMKDIQLFSYCEHHLALMYNMKVAVAYIPNKRVIGLSKIARIADMVGKRLQLQERIGADIAYIMRKVTDTEDVAIIIEGEHSCMTTRGIKKPNTKTITTTLSGRFEENMEIYQKLMALYKV